jgi:hypothetical protein
MTQVGDDFIQEGQLTCWITEIGSLNTETFVEFIARINSNKTELSNLGKQDNIVTYNSQGKKHSLNYKGEYTINEKVMDLNYNRFESPYTLVKRNSKTMEIRFATQKLYYDFDKAIREVVNM